jgi:hypothetical protein
VQDGQIRFALQGQDRDLPPEVLELSGNPGSEEGFEKFDGLSRIAGTDMNVVDARHDSPLLNSFFSGAKIHPTPG